MIPIRQVGASVLAVALSAPALAQDAPPVRADAKAVATAMLDEARLAVFQLRVKADGGTFALGTGFLVDASGLAVTNFHVVEGADAADAVFADLKVTVPVTLVGAKPDYDLALVKVPVADTRLRGHVRSLTIRSDQVPPGTDVWALGFPHDIGFTVTKGVASGLRTFDKVPAAVRVSLPYDAQSTWIQTDCTINHGNSGGPLIDAAAQVVGVNTWSGARMEHTYFALSGQHVSDLIKSYKPGSYTFTDARKARTFARVPHGSFPHLEVPKEGRGQELLRAATDFKRNRNCRSCRGTGTITSRVRTGSTSSGGLIYPTYSNQTTSCSRCSGTAYIETAILWTFASKVVNSLARLPDDDPQYAKALEFTKESLQEVLSLNAQSLATQLNDKAVTVFTDKFFKAGLPVICVGRMVKDSSAASGTVRMQAVELVNKRQLVYVTGPQIVDATENETVLIGGLLAGRVDGTGGELIPVIQDGFTVAVRAAR